MQRKSLSFVTILFVLCLLFVQTASKALTPGWVYSYGSIIQNNSGVAVYFNVYDYIDHRVNGFTFTGSTGAFKSVNAQVQYNMTGVLCNDVILTGQGTFSSTLAGVTTTTGGNYTAHMWKGTVGGVSGTWVQAELWSTDGKTLLWATGATWPCASSSPMKLAGSILRVPTP